MINVAHAETQINSGSITVDTVWTKENSPYIINTPQLTISTSTLTIEPGVNIIGSLLNNRWRSVIVNDGRLNILGTAEEPVVIRDLGSLSMYRSQANVSHLDMSSRRMGSGLSFFDSSRGYVDSSIFTENNSALGLDSSYVEVKNVRITDNNEGIEVAGPWPQSSFRDPNLPWHPSTVLISSSTITNQKYLSIRNESSFPVQVQNNWWGSTDGPTTITPYENYIPNAILGPAEYSPWLLKEPDFGPSPLACCSSILFLPGLEATRLYKPDTVLFGTVPMANRLWEPNRNDDVRKLFLDSNGSSTDNTIYAGEPIGKALGVISIYGSFMKFLDELTQQGVIGEWKSFGYDWRKPIAEVVAGSTLRATASESLITTVEDLASRSRTGKVTLVAHSNGGLVAKYLVKTLAEAGKEKLIDSVVSVAVPYLGTPQAILGILHGDNQSIAGGLILKQSVAKQLATNMPGAYSLIPSATYFSKVFGPTIAFASTSAPITTASAQDSFMSLHANGFLMNAAEIFHAILDPFTWPATIARWAIVGWGNKTAKGIVYSKAESSATSTSSTYSPAITSMGDGTVVAPSATYNSGTTTSINLPLVSSIEHRKIDHSNILDSENTKSAIKKIITNNSNAPGYDAKAIEDALVKIPSVTIGEPDYSKESTFLVVSTHSPVNIHVYDKNGNHTGIAALPAGADEDIEDGLLTYFEQNIPGSSFESHGDENQPENYISLPDNSGEKYSVIIQGTGVGEFTYDVERIRGDVTLSSVEYAGLPVTPLLVASTTVSGGLQSTTTTLNLDVDGNGSVDIQAKANSTLDPIVFFESIKKTILQLLGSSKDADGFVRRINRIEDLFRKNKLSRIDGSVNTLKRQIGSKRLTTLSQSEKDDIVNMINQFLAQFE
jgi:pimeloyl-ACP methyl ester carboxylesterase